MNNQSSAGFGNSTASVPGSTDWRASGTPDSSSTASAQSASTQDNSQKETTSIGKFTNTSKQLKFVGSEHWESILEDITELKMDLESSSTTERAEYRPRILFGLKRASRSEILSSIPPRQVCDTLIARFSNTLDVASMMVHIPKFLREYDKMFEDPDETPLMWFGLLFSVLGVASYFYVVSGEAIPGMPEIFTSTKQMTSHFLDRTAQCLAEANYLCPCRYTLETLCLYYALETFHAKMSDFSSYVVLGIIIRVAMRLGYHRDSSHYPSISIFDGEMRRRLWLMVFQLDLAVSAQVGLSRMIREGETDTAEPKNLLDTDFDEGITELPQPRPDSDTTAVTYVIYKVRILRQLGSIMDRLNSVEPPSYAEVLRLDDKLLETHATLPQDFAMRPLNLSVTDSADLVLRRFALENSFQKSRCVLHRKYLITGKSDPQFKYSRVSCIDAAMRLLHIQITFDESSQSGGQFSREQWRTAGSFHQDYILAAMVICLDLTRGRRPGHMEISATKDDIDSAWPRNERLQALQKSYAIWEKSSSKSTLASKATEALRVMLKDLQSSPTLTDSAPAIPIANPRSTPPFDSTRAVQIIEERKSTDRVVESTLYFMDFMSVPADTTDIFMAGGDTDLDMNMNFDWGLWDSQFQANPVPDEYDLSRFQ